MGRDGWMEALLNLVYPRRPACPLCRHNFIREEEAVCPRCREDVIRLAVQPPFCRVCGREMRGRGVCGDCVRRPEVFFVRAAAFGAYRGRLREALRVVKRGRGEDLVSFLSGCLAEAWAARMATCGAEVLVPVPMGEERRRERGFNQAEELARGLGALVRVHVCADALAWQGPGRSQASKGREERLIGVEEAVVVGRGAEQVKGRVVCLVDDIYTTGSTANACARRLLEAGARAVYVLTVAR